MADEMTMAQDDHLRDLVAEVAAAYFSNSHVAPSDIPTVVQQIASSLASVGTASAPAAAQEPSEEASPEVAVKKATPAQVRKSITPDALVSFEDGKPYKTLKRHLTTRGMTLADYREKWGLPKDYPTVAPNYSATRSAMAKSLGLGQLSRKQSDPAAKPAGLQKKAAAPTEA
jgi:predicted transcriptional regulator